MNQPRNPEIGEDRALEQFQKFVPPKFLGGPDPEIAEQWLEAIINISAALNYTEQRQVNFAVFQFEGPAEHGGMLLGQSGSENRLHGRG